MFFLPLNFCQLASNSIQGNIHSPLTLPESKFHRQIFTSTKKCSHSFDCFGELWELSVQPKIALGKKSPYLFYFYLLKQYYFHALFHFFQSSWIILDLIKSIFPQFKEFTLYIQRGSPLWQELLLVALYDCLSQIIQSFLRKHWSSSFSTWPSLNSVKVFLKVQTTCYLIFFFLPKGPWILFQGEPQF